MIKFAQQKRKRTKCAKRQRKSSRRQNTCDTRVACRIIVAESKLFVAYFSGGAAQFDYADDYDEEVSYLLAPFATTNHLPATLNANLPFSTARVVEKKGGGEFPKLSLQTVAGPVASPQCGPEGGLFKLSVDKHAKSRRNRPCGLTMRMAMGSMLAGIE